MNIESIIFPLFWGIGIGGMLWSIWTLVLSLAAKSWPVARGHIHRYGIDISYDSDRERQYEAKIHYSFKVRERPYSGERIGFGLVGTNIPWLASSPLKKAIRNYPRVKVRYQADNPKRSTVLVGLQFFHLVNFAFFSFWLWFMAKSLTNAI